MIKNNYFLLINVRKKQAVSYVYPHHVLLVVRRVQADVSPHGGVPRRSELLLQVVEARLVELHLGHRPLHSVSHQLHVEHALLNNVLRQNQISIYTKNKFMIKNLTCLPILLSAFSSVLPVARLLLFCIHSRSITMPCWGTLSGYSAWIRLISDCCTPSSLASGTQSWPSRLQMSERRRSARWIDSVVRVAAHTQNAKLVSPNNSKDQPSWKINCKKRNFVALLQNWVTDNEKQCWQAVDENIFDLQWKKCKCLQHQISKRWLQLSWFAKIILKTLNSEQKKNSKF